MVSRKQQAVPSPQARNAASTREHARLAEPYVDPVPPWRRWGPYVSDRSWGSVREDYSADGNAWDFLTHDQARSKAYRWGEDGIAGICDRYQLLVFALAFWNGRDPILKERMFGLSCNEGNHGEDVKEYWFYLDNTPTHSYMRMLYKYPQKEYPYQQLLEENRRRGSGAEFELLDTGIFDDDRYFDIFIEYAKESPEDICIRVEAFNRGPEAAELHVLPHLWFRNTWAWTDPPSGKPTIHGGAAGKRHVMLLADDSTAKALENIQLQYALGRRYLYAESGGELLFTDNETNASRLYGPSAVNRSPYVKDAFHRYVVNGEQCVNPLQLGTKACIHYRAQVAAEEFDCLPSAPDQRRDGRPTPRRGRSSGSQKERRGRILRSHPSSRGDGGGEADTAARFRRHVVGKTDLPVRRRALAGRRQHSSSRRPQETTQYPLAPPEFDARAFRSR